MDQPFLFECFRDKPFVGTGEIRSRVGGICEEAVCACLQWERQKIDGSKRVCVDALRPDGSEVELKGVSAVKGGLKSVIYDFRLHKELDAFPSLDYAFCLHSVQNPDSLREAFVQAASQPIRVIVVRAWEVWLLARRQPLRRIRDVASPRGSRNGYTREGYADGYYNVPVGDFLSQVHPGDWEPARSATLEGLAFSCTAARVGFPIPEPAHVRKKRDEWKEARRKSNS